MLRCQIIDDDPWIHDLLCAMLEGTDSDIAIESSQLPVVAPGRDLYFIDNTFGTVSVAPSLVQHARAANPQAVTVVLTSLINREQTKAILNAGCDYLIYKNEQAAMLQTIRNAISKASAALKHQDESLASATPNPSSRTRSFWHEIKELIRVWNRTIVLQNQYRSNLSS